MSERLVKNKDFPLSVPQNQTKEETKNMLFNTIDKLVEEHDSKKSRNTNIIYYSGITAAIIIILIVLNNFSTIESFESDKAYPIHYNLPDNSEIIVSSNSNFKFNKSLYKKNRIIRFYGEGYFDVMKGVNFEVKGDLGTVSVLGTSFSVLSTKYEFNVKCYDGKVKVKNNIGRDFLLLPGYEIIITSDDGGVISDFNNEKLPNWYSNQIEYNSTELSVIFNDLENIFGVKFILDIETSRKYTGKISPERIDNALRMVCLPMNLNYEIINDNTYRIY